MKVIIGLLLGGSCLAASGLAADPLRQLSDTQMDVVAAGDASATASAAGLGAFVSTDAHTAALALRDAGSRNDRSDMGGNAYAAAGNASAYGTEGSATGATGSTSSGVPGATTQTRSWTLNVNNVSISSGFSHTASSDRGPLLQ